MIDYIVKKDFLIYLAKNNNYECLDIPLTRLFNNLLKPYLTDLKSREKQTKLYFNFSSKIPIYIDRNHIFLAINTYRLSDSLYLNYFSIYKWEKIRKGVLVEFISGHCLILSSYNKFIKQIEKIKIILADKYIKLNNL
ncbi:MAG: hypothetical protein ACOCV1_03190 [Bacillota bacterium]